MKTILLGLLAVPLVYLASGVLHPNSKNSRQLIADETEMATRIIEARSRFERYSKLKQTLETNFERVNVSTTPVGRELLAVAGKMEGEAEIRLAQAQVNRALNSAMIKSADTLVSIFQDFPAAQAAARTLWAARIGPPVIRVFPDNTNLLAVYVPLAQADLAKNALSSGRHKAVENR